jgi:hypothetical protein
MIVFVDRVIVGVFASSLVDRGFEIQSGQTKLSPL